MAVSKPMQTEFGIHHRLESCEGVLTKLVGFWVQVLPTGRYVSTLWACVLVARHFTHFNQPAIQARKVVFIHRSFLQKNGQFSCELDPFLVS